MSSFYVILALPALNDKGSPVGDNHDAVSGVTTRLQQAG